MTFILLESSGKLAHGPRHQPIPQRTGTTWGGDRRTFTKALSQHTYWWDTKCGKTGIVYVDGRFFEDVPHCQECAGNITSTESWFLK